MLPQIKESLGKISQIFEGLITETLNLAVDSLNRGLKGLKAFEGDFAKVGKVISENVKSLSKVLSKHFEAVRKELSDIYKLVVDYVKSLQGFDAIKQKIEVVSWNETLVYFEIFIVLNLVFIISEHRQLKN